ncbi:MAG: hypothetical protein V4718_04280 [Pseudomonadota bacterium]
MDNPLEELQAVARLTKQDFALAAGFQGPEFQLVTEPQNWRTESAPCAGHSTPLPTHAELVAWSQARKAAAREHGQQFPDHRLDMRPDESPDQRALRLQITFSNRNYL